MIADFVTVAGPSIAALLAVRAVTFAIAARIGRYNVVDVAWGLGFIAVALVAAIVGDGDASRRWLLPALVAIWGLRLSWYVNRRSRGKGGDPRYADLLPGATLSQVVRKVFVMQGLTTWFVALPRTVGVDTSSQLLRRRMRLVGIVAGHGHRLVVAGDGGIPAAADMKGRPGFDEYQARTSFFIPRPPRLTRR